MGLSLDGSSGGRTTTDLAGGLVNETRIDPELLTIPQVAERLKLSRGTVYRLISIGELPVVKIGKSSSGFATRGVSRIDAGDLQKYIDANKRVA